MQADCNLYPGVNAHLNSYLQLEPGGWQSFHAAHVTHLYEALDATLPSNYYARPEKTLQISEVVPPVAPRPHRFTTPDVTVFRTGEGIVTKGEMGTSGTSRRLPLQDVLDEEDLLPGVTIYQVVDSHALGKPVTRIELLSPANKPGGTHGDQYLVKRMDTLRSGLHLVEIDYLHHSAPVVRGLPSYSDQDSDAYPYLVAISSPFPSLAQGSVALYEIGVDDSLPQITVPLAGDDNVILDLGAVYNHTLVSSRFFRLVVDYATEPVAMHRYTTADQVRIRQRLLHIRGE